MALYSNNNGIFSTSGKQIIPSVTSADAGKVLTVGDAGEWEAAAASGGGGILLVKIYDLVSKWGVTYNSGKIVRTSVPAEDIAQAFFSGKMVVIANSTGEYSTILIPDIYQSTVNAYGYIMAKQSTDAMYIRHYRVALTRTTSSANVSVLYLGSVKLLDAES